MRIAALYDIDGNLPGLEAVLAELEADLGLPDVDELMLRESLLEPVGSAFVARHFEERATR